MNELIEEFKKKLTAEQLENFKSLEQKINSIEWNARENEMRISKLIEANNNLMDTVLKKIAPAENTEQKKTPNEAAKDISNEG